MWTGRARGRRPLKAWKVGSLPNNSIYTEKEEHHHVAPPHTPYITLGLFSLVLLSSPAYIYIVPSTLPPPPVSPVSDQRMTS